MTSALKGREGGPGKADEVREFSKGGCVKMQTRGVKKFEYFADVIYDINMEAPTYNWPMAIRPVSRVEIE